MLKGSDVVCCYMYSSSSYLYDIELEMIDGV